MQINNYKCINVFKEFAKANQNTAIQQQHFTMTNTINRIIINNI